jgi:hypothetical protein
MLRSRYCLGSGNVLDLGITACFVVAFLCRALALAAQRSEPYTVMYVLLTLNLFACHIRLLKCFQALRRFGEIHIIVVTTCKRDVAPFMPYLFLVVICFETSAYFLSWILAEESFRSSHHFWLSNIVIAVLTDLRLLYVLFWRPFWLRFTYVTSVLVKKYRDATNAGRCSRTCGSAGRCFRTRAAWTQRSPSTIQPRGTARRRRPPAAVAAVAVCS